MADGSGMGISRAGGRGRLGAYIPRTDETSIRERGATLVEFALIAPLLLALLLGIVDFGWLLAQQQDVRYGAREASRLATVNTGSTASMTTAACDAMDIASGASIVWNTGGGGTGDTGSVDVTISVGSLTGFSSLPFVGVIYPSTLTSSVEFRLEQDATNWSNGTGTC